MKCDNCGFENGANTKFCQACGNEITSKNERFFGTTCPNCGSSLERDSLFCKKCGYAIKNVREDKRFCPVCQRALSQNATFCGVCGTQFGAVAPLNNRPVPPQKEGSLVGVIVSLCIVLVISVITILLVWNLNKDVDINASDFQNETSEAPATETVFDEVVALPTQQVTQSENDSSYQFNQESIVRSPSYRSIDNSEYSYRCVVPEHFIQKEDGCYYAPDETAVMDVYASSNYSNASANEAMNDYISEIGGEVTYNASGDTWFAVSMRKDGMAYYRKGFVDHYLRFFSFSFPEEYLEIYEDYIEYIEDNFKRTDV